MSSSIHQEALSILSEECAGVIKSCSKIMRFGTGSSWDGVTNSQTLAKEVGSLLAVIDIALELDIIRQDEIIEAKMNKFKSLAKWSNIVGVENHNGLLKKANQLI
jgi:hypothetical protein